MRKDKKYLAILLVSSVVLTLLHNIFSYLYGEDSLVASISFILAIAGLMFFIVYFIRWLLTKKEISRW